MSALSGKLNHNYKHGFRNHHFYKRYHAIINRCYNKNAAGYKNWGGRGIRVCTRWHNFLNFKEDMYPSFLEHVKEYGRKNTMIERINNDGPYSPSNCRWATRIEQNSNFRRNRIIEYGGVKETMSGWARILKLDRSTIWYRIKSGWPLEKVLTSGHYANNGKLSKKVK